MANVLTILRITPSDPSLNREDYVNDVLKNKLSKECNVEFLKYDEEPVAFGIYAIKAYFKNEDSETGTQDIEKLQELIEQNNSISSVEMDMQTLMDH